jgi:hypothetical protein
MNDLDGWGAYSRASFRIQYSDGVRWKRHRASVSRSRRLLMRPGQVEVSWPGWSMASVRTWW